MLPRRRSGENGLGHRLLDDDRLDGKRPKQHHRHAHFNNTSNNITTCVFALIECFKPAGMWTHVPA